MNNALDLFDQTFASLERAAGVLGLLQCVWVYDRAIDIDGVRRFQSHLQRGRVSRRIQRSRLPFGRDRWTASSGRSGLEIVATPRPREEFDAWLREQAATPLDFEHGPEWHLAVLPFTDGGAGVSLLIPHCLTDGIGLCEALADAASGRHDTVSWPGDTSRPRRRALLEDARQFACDMPGIGRALVAAITAARAAARAAGAAESPVQTPTDPDELCAVPTTTIFVDADEWDTRARSLGGTGNSLLAGLAARLAQRMGRVTTDGSVTLVIPVNERTADDTRANAVANVGITVDPASVTTDLRDVRAATKQALIRRQELPDERWELLPLALVSPPWLVRRMVGMAAGSANSVISSNLGVIDPAVYQPDGTTADHFTVLPHHPRATTANMHRQGGLVSLVSGRVHERIFVTVHAYHPGSSNSNHVLQQHLSDALQEFSLSAIAGWPSPEFV
jgi:hypothetical protein